MEHFLELSPPYPARREPTQPFYQTVTTTDYHSNNNSSPIDTSMYGVDYEQKCCEACKCNCQTGGCKNVDTGQQHAIRQNHPYMLCEALQQLMQTSTSEDSYGAARSVDPESCAPGHRFAAPSLDLLGHSPAHRTDQEMLADRWAAYFESVNADPFRHFVSLPDESNLGFDEADIFGMQDVTESTMATPGLSSSSISLLSGWSHLFQQGGNNSNSDLAGVGVGVETNSFLRLSPHDRL